MPNPTRYALATLGLLAAGIVAGPIAFAQDKPVSPPSLNGATNDDHMKDGSMMKMMGRMNKMMDQCEKMMERNSDPAKRPEMTPPR